MPSPFPRPLLGWSTRAGVDALRITGLPDDISSEQLEVCLYRADGSGPPITGRFDMCDDGLAFVPRYPFLTGSVYGVRVRDAGDGAAPALITREPTSTAPPTTVLEIAPTSRAVPRNTLRLYVSFSAPMSDGASRHILLRNAGTRAAIEDAFLPTDQELWDADHRRLTVLFDPARIKRGLRPHEELSYPLVAGTEVEVVVDAGARDADGRPLLASFTQRYRVDGDLRTRVDPSLWAVGVAATGSIDALVVVVDRPLDRALLPRCVAIADAQGARVAGDIRVADDDRAWRFVPRAQWPDGELTLVVNPALEDVAGNSVAAVFDRNTSLDAAGAPTTRVRVPRS